MRSHLGLWMQHTLYDSMLGKGSFTLGFPLLSAGSCLFLQARRRLLKYKTNLHDPSYCSHGDRDLLLFADGTLRYLQFCAGTEVRSYTYNGSDDIVLFGPLGRLAMGMSKCDIGSNDRQKLEEKVLEQLSPRHNTEVDVNLITQLNLPSGAASNLWLSAIFFQSLNKDNKVHVTICLTRQPASVKWPACLNKHLWSSEGTLHLFASSGHDQ